MEPGRSHPHKPSVYGRLLIDYKGVPGRTRRLAELLINRLLKTRHPRGQSPAYHLDGLKGTSNFEEANPRYDRAFASRLCANRTMANVQGITGEAEPNWMLPHKARQFVKAVLGCTTAQAKSVVDHLPHEFQQVSREAAYAASKLFYGFDAHRVFDPAARLAFNIRLEKTVRHRGALVTAPCYGRAADVPRFASFMAGPKVTFHRFISPLPAAYRQLLKQHRAADQRGGIRECDRLERKALRLGFDAAPSPADRHDPASDRLPKAATIPTDRLDQDNDLIEQFRGLCRAAMHEADGDIELAARIAAQWYEDTGLASGDSPAEHDARVDRARRYLHSLPPFDKKKRSRNGFQLTREWATGDGADEIRAVIGDELHSQYKTKGLGWPFIAAIYGAIVEGVSTVEAGKGPETLRDVSRNYLEARLADVGMKRPRATIARAVEVLRAAGLIKMVRDYWIDPERLSPGRCRAWLVNTARYCPAWATGHVPIESQIIIDPAHPLPHPL